MIGALTGAVEREAGRWGSAGRTDDVGRGQEPKRGTNVTALPRALGTHCSSLRKEVPCLITDNWRGGTT